MPRQGSAIGQFVSVDLVRCHLVADFGQLAADMLDALHQPFWGEGPLKGEHVSSELAGVGYQMAADKIYAYELPDS